MDDYRQQQIDVLKEAVPYSEKLIGAIEKVSEELSGVPFPETHDAVNVIIEGLNWLFEVYNGTYRIYIGWIGGKLILITNKLAYSFLINRAIRLSWQRFFS